MLFDLLSIAVFGVLLLLIAFTFRDYGISWYGPIQSRYGELIPRFFWSGLEDRTVLLLSDLHFYGGLFDTFLQLLTRAFPFQPFNTRHLFVALTWILGIVGAWFFARYLGGSMGDFLTVLFLPTIPSLYGRSFMNPKDISFATGYIWTLFFTAKAAAGFPKILLAFHCP